MIVEVCLEIKNWFTDREDIHVGNFEIKGGLLQSPFDLKEGQYFRICGSTFNDGIYRYGRNKLVDEEFHGAIWCMKVPRDFIELVEEIETFVSKNDETSTFLSESFGGYSYSKASKNGMPLTWRDVFRNRLNRYRKI